MSSYQPDKKFKKKIISYNGTFKNEKTYEVLGIKTEDSLTVMTVGNLKKTSKGMETDKDSTLEVRFGSMNIQLLLDIFEEAYEAFKEGKKFDNEAIAPGDATQLVQISDGSNIGRDYGLYLVVYRDANIDEDFKNCKHRIYTFGSKKTIINFAKNKDFKIKERDIDAKAFRRILATIADASTSAISHSIRQATSYDTDKLASQLAALCQAQGIQVIGSVENKRPTGMYEALPQNNQAPSTYELPQPDVSNVVFDTELFD